jgi:hypothetical protein
MTILPNTLKIEFGDFQTPEALAAEVCALLAEKNLSPAALLEPTCGKGNFLAAAVNAFPTSTVAYGLEFNADYLSLAAKHAVIQAHAKGVKLVQANFFEYDWFALLATLPEPLLVFGNPPWVTNSGLGALGRSNLPAKTNFQQHTGLDALTGKSNFDISEWMLIHLLEHLRNKDSTLAMLCKTAVARKVLKHAWKHGLNPTTAEIYPIDAMAHFGAAVDACLFLCSFSAQKAKPECRVYASLDSKADARVIGYRSGQLIADLNFYEANPALFSGDSAFQWRSGIKHDCAKVMEFTRRGNDFINGFGESVDIEETYLFPMFKSSALASKAALSPSKWMLVPQTRVGENTDLIQTRVPKTWEYLTRHASLLSARKSAIYKGKPQFSIFGVGDYSFAPWKVAVSGLYKRLAFKVVGPFHEKPAVLDDTCYFLPFQEKSQAITVATLLNSPLGRQCLESLIFWDAKRPVTIDILKQINLTALAEALHIDLSVETLSSVTSEQFTPV